jgi:hypothetical protein
MQRAGKKALLTGYMQPVKLHVSASTAQID